LATPFSYNGTDNLVLAIDDNSNNYNSSSYTFYTHNANNQCIYFYSDSYNPDPSNPTSAGASNSVYSYRSNVRFTMCNSTLPPCPGPAVTVMDVTPNSVELTWAPLGNETRWKVDYSTNSTTWYSAGTFTSRSHRFSGLQPNTLYYFRVGAICSGDTTYTNVMQSTECALMSFPVVENFDRLTTGTNNPLSPCWTKLSTYSTGYPYVTNSYASSTPNSLYFYSYSSYHTGFVTPKSPEPLNRLQISFTLYKGNTSYIHALMIGAMTDPDDFSTFEPIDTVEPDNMTGYYHYTVPLTNYRGNGRYIGVFGCNYGSSYSYPYVDDVEIDYYATCSRVTNLQTQSNSPFSAISTWQPGRSGIPDYYIVSYRPSTTNAWTTDTTHNTYKVLTNIVGGETYYISVTPVCSGNDTSYPCYDTLTTTSCMSQPLVVVGANSSSSINVPMETDVDYGYSQQIYDAAVLGGPNTFSAIAFNYTGSVAFTAKTNCTIYMGNTTNTTYVSGTVATFVPDSLLTVVYVGPMNCVPGWNVFTLDTTFYYDGTSNLVVAIDDNSALSAVGSATFATHTTTGNKSAVIGAFMDIDPVAPVVPPIVYSYRNDITLYYCDTSATCAPPTVSSTGVTDNSIQIAWAPGLRETRWIVERGTSSNGPWTYVTTTSQRTYTFNNLNSSTRYYFRVGAICPNDTLYGSVTDSTDCAYVTRFPYTEGFEAYQASSALNSTIGLCWSRKNTQSQTQHYPYVDNSRGSNGTFKSMYYYTSSSQWALLATPPMGVSVSRLMVTLDLFRTNSSYYGKLAVGVMTDPTDITTFVGIDTVWGSYNTWETFTISLENYSGTGKYIAFVAVQNEVTYMNLDNIIIDTIPNCPKPTNLITNSITSNSAFTSWRTGTVGDGITNLFIVQWKRSSQSSWSNADTTSNNYYFFSGLNANTSYDVRIKAVCTCGDSSDFATTTFTTSSCLVGGDASVEQGSTTTYYLPINNNSNYSYTQQLYTNAELGGPKNLTAVEFFYQSNTAMTAKDSVTIYLGHTNLSTFQSYNDYIPVNQLTPVYTGNLNATSRGWNRFVFNTPFYYNGVDNLVIAIDDNSGVSQGSSYPFYVHNASNKAIFFYSSTDVNPSALTISGTLYSYRNSIKFISPCNNSASCVAPNARILSNTSNSVDLIWRPGNTDTIWVVLYKPRTDSIWHIADTTTNTTYTLNNLSAISTYDIRVMSLCGGDSAYAELTAHTGCGSVSAYPYTEDFESYAASTSYYTYGVNDKLPNCWDFYSSGSYTHARRNDYCPRIFGSTSHSYLPNNNGKALIINASNYSPSSSSIYNYQTIGAHQYAVLPPFADSLPRYTVSFKYVTSSTNT
ncbi:MAG: fibronectin type III domain-containing protein, partial [Bacteroidales bacterium]|nr:fibronectin type III domain-containing protein [Bacteroidales bacterium]